MNFFESAQEKATRKGYEEFDPTERSDSRSEAGASSLMTEPDQKESDTRLAIKKFQSNDPNHSV